MKKQPDGTATLNEENSQLQSDALTQEQSDLQQVLSAQERMASFRTWDEDPIIPPEQWAALGARLNRSRHSK